MLDDKKTKTPPADNADEKKVPADDAGKSADEKSDEEKLTEEAEAKKLADDKSEEETKKGADDVASMKKTNQRLQSQVDKIRANAEAKKEQLESQLEATEDPAEKLKIERAVFDLERGLFELDRDTSTGTSLADTVTSTLSELGYDADSEIAKKLLAIVEKGGDGAKEAINMQLDLLKSIGPKVKTAEEKKDKAPADIDANKDKGDKPNGDTVPAVSASDFGKGGETREKAISNLEGFLEKLADKGI
jgi:predicted RNase H-like nuclease (RuvC/YqgF family)